MNALFLCFSFKISSSDLAVTLIFLRIVLGEVYFEFQLAVVHIGEGW